MIFQKFTLMFDTMSIETSNFTAYSQIILASVFQTSFCEPLFFVYCPAISEVTPPLFLGKQKAGIAPGLSCIVYFISSML